MSKNDHLSNYEHIESLVHSLHTPNHLAHPENIHSPDTNYPHLLAKHPCRSTVSNAHHKFMVHSQLSRMPSPPPSSLAMIIDEDELPITDNSHTVTHHGHTSTSKGIANDIHGIPLPAVMVNDVVEPLDLISTTQRRFSQLYLGLRRLSTSNTVGLCVQRCKKIISHLFLHSRVDLL